MARTPSWRDQAACASRPGSTDIKHQHGPNPVLSTIAAARPIIETFCANCPVTRQCANWAQGEEFFEGVAGSALFMLRHQPITITPRPPMDGWGMRYNKARPDQAHLTHPDQPVNGRVRAACGVLVNTGTVGISIERVLAMPRCRPCQQAAGVIMPPPVRQPWSDTVRRTGATEMRSVRAVHGR